MHLVGAETVPYALNGQSHASDIYVEQNSRAALGVLFDKHARGMTFQLAHIFANLQSGITNECSVEQRSDEG